MPTVRTALAFPDDEPDHERIGRDRRRTRRNSQAQHTGRSQRGRERYLSVRGELREKPDVGKIARAVIQMALAQAETDAAALAAAAKDSTAQAQDTDGTTEAGND